MKEDAEEKKSFWKSDDQFDSHKWTLPDKKYLVPGMAIVGALLYRWRGWGGEVTIKGKTYNIKKYFPRPFNQAVFAIPYAALALPDPGVHWLAWPILIPIFLLLVTTAFVCSGHGGFMDLGSWKTGREDERLEFLIKWLKNDMQEYWYDALGLAVTGLAITLPAGLVTGHPFIGLTGVLKAPAYMISERVGFGTAGGEVLTGAFLWGSLAWLL